MDARELEELQERMRAFDEERERLAARIAQLEQENRCFLERFLEVEEENNRLANLFVASAQLHASLDRERTLGTIVEVMANLVGADRFVVHLLDGDLARLEPVAGHGVELADAPAPRLGEGAVGGAVLRGEPWWRDDHESHPEAGETPLVVIPLCAGSRPVGAIAVHRLLRHKSGFSRLDRELLALLGGQAATALLAARDAGASHGRERPGSPAAADELGR